MRRIRLGATTEPGAAPLVDGIELPPWSDRATVRLYDEPAALVADFDAGAIDLALMPAHESDAEVLKKLPVGQPIRVKVTRVRNPQFHRKFFALLNYLYDIWEPPVAIAEHELRSGKFDPDLAQPEKNFDRFRKDIIILAGFFTHQFRVDGSVRVEPKSISFAAMDETEFEELYGKVIDVGLKYVARNYSEDELRAVVDQIMEFDG